MDSLITPRIIVVLNFVILYITIKIDHIYYILSIFYIVINKKLFVANMLLVHICTCCKTLYSTCIYLQIGSVHSYVPLIMTPYLSVKPLSYWDQTLHVHGMNRYADKLETLIRPYLQHRCTQHIYDKNVLGMCTSFLVFIIPLSNFTSSDVYIL